MDSFSQMCMMTELLECYYVTVKVLNSSLRYSVIAIERNEYENKKIKHSCWAEKGLGAVMFLAHAWQPRFLVYP